MRSGAFWEALADVRFGLIPDILGHPVQSLLPAESGHQVGGFQRTRMAGFGTSLEHARFGVNASEQGQRGVLLVSANAGRRGLRGIECDAKVKWIGIPPSLTVACSNDRSRSRHSVALYLVL